MKNIKYIIVIGVLIFIGVSIYWFYNPTIYHKDFDLEFRVSNKGKNFYKERNKKIEKQKFTFNDERYINDSDKYELIIHSLDIIEGKEKIIIVCDKLSNDSRIANITYKDETSKYYPIKIEHKEDSIFIIQNLEDKYENKIIFKGKKIRTI